MDDVQMGVASGWVGLSLRRVLGFGGHVCGVINGLCHGLTDGNGWTARRWESASGWARLSMRRVLGFGGRVRGVVNGLCHGLADGNGWTARKWESLRQAQPNGFGVGGVVPAAGCGFRRACPWGGQRTLSRTHGQGQSHADVFVQIPGQHQHLVGQVFFAGVLVGFFLCQHVPDSDQ